MIYNHTTQKLNTYDFIVKAGEFILDANVSGNFIGVLKRTKGKAYYYYSEDNGHNWIKEKLPDNLVAGYPTLMYGKGLVWVKAVQNLYNLQVRKALVNKVGYGVNYEFSLPSELQINDVVIDMDLQRGVSGFNFINQYILKNGKQKIKVKIIHPFVEKGGLIKPKNLLKIDEEFELYKVDVDNDKLKLIKKLNFPKLDHPVPYIEHTWEFDAALPFDLVGWENSEDLSQWDKDELEKKVVQKFEQLRAILHSGNGAEFVKELTFANKEYFIANYFTEEQQKEYTNNLIEAYNEHKGIMPPIENYRMRIMGDGKVVTLENLGKYVGQCVLTAEAKDDNTLFQHYVMLHIPKGSKDFEIVRINSQMATVEKE